MKGALAIAMTVVIAVGAVVAGAYLYNSFHAAPSPDSNVSSSCSDPGSISGHVYHSDRLRLVKSCIKVSGIVDNVINEKDGDVHLRLNLDPAYSSLTNNANDQYQYGDLVVEIICVNMPTQQDAIASCQNYTNRISIPDVGEHITVTGPYVLDGDHYNWAEIHPVYSLVIPSLMSGVNISHYVLNISYPDGSAYGWLGPTPRFYATNITVSGGDQFTDTLTFYSTSPSVQNITSIAITTPGFSLVSVSPKPPVTFSAGETVNITLTIQTPDANYNGAIDLHIGAS